MVNFRELATHLRKLAKEDRERIAKRDLSPFKVKALAHRASVYSLISQIIESNLLIFPLDPEDEEETGLEPEEVLKDAEGGKE